MNWFDVLILEYNGKFIASEFQGLFNFWLNVW